MTSHDGMTPQDLHHLAAAYALDALDPPERQAFEAHYPTCDICSQDVVLHRETAAALASGLEVSPPPSLRDRVLAEVDKTPQLSPLMPDREDHAVTDLADLAEHRRRRFGQSWVVGAAAALVVVMAVGFLGLLAGLRIGSGTNLDDVIAAPDAVVASLEGSDGSIQVIWSAERTEVAVLADGLDQPGLGRTYELWFLGDGGPVPIGLFQPEGSGTVRAVLPTAGIIGPDSGGPDSGGVGNGFGVTIEPAGGSPQPTSDVLYIGTP